MFQRLRLQSFHYVHMLLYVSYTHEGCPESIGPFWKSREPFVRPWCNLATSQSRPYCASVNSHSPVGLVSRQWDAWPSLCAVWPSHSKWPSEQIRFITTMHMPILQFSCWFFFLQSFTSPRSVSPLLPTFVSLRLLTYPKDKIAFEREVICECGGHTVHKLSQRHLTADWLAPRESDCSLIHSKVSYGWLPSYIKATRPDLEIFKMDGYFPGRPRTATYSVLQFVMIIQLFVKFRCNMFN